MNERNLIVSFCELFATAETSRDSLLDTLDAYYVVETSVQIKRAGFKSIALQFPDPHLPAAPVVNGALKSLLGGEVLVFVLGDTSYGSCCADEVAAEHLGADAIVHYGQSCLSPTRSLPVLHIFPQLDATNDESRLDMLKDAVRNIMQDEQGADRIVVMYDIDLADFIMNAVAAFGQDHSNNLVFAEPCCPDLKSFVPPENGTVETGALKLSIDSLTSVEEFINCGPIRFPKSSVAMERTVILWLSVENDSEEFSQTLRNVALRLANGLAGSCRAFFRLSSDGILKTVNGFRAFKRRLSVIARVRDAERIGVVAGSLAVVGVKEAIEESVQQIENAGKRAYVLLVGKITPSKLMNFEEMDAFVFVSCVQRTIVCAVEVSAPIITPYELSAALKESNDFFERPYVVGFEVGGVKRDSEEARSDCKTNIVQRGRWALSAGGTGSAASYFKRRTWKGLPSDAGGADDRTPVSKLSTDVIQGSSGIATRYCREDSG